MSSKRTTDSPLMSDPKAVLSALHDAACGTLPESTAKNAQTAAGIALDEKRRRRTGLDEVVLGLGKNPQQLIQCVQGLFCPDHPVLATRLVPEQGRVLMEAFPEGHFHEASGLFCLGKELFPDKAPWPQQGDVLVVTAGSSDLSVALEAYGTGCFLDLQCGLICDAGVAGIHRLTPHMENLCRARAVIVVAGMDGALPSLIAGLVPAPVIAVPSSQGKNNLIGALSSLLAMLNSCSPGIATVNVDNGFGAACFAAKLIQTAARHQQQ